MPELTEPSRFVPDPNSLLELAIFAGAEADYNRWKAVGPVELPALSQADPYTARVFTDRSTLILTAALEVLEAGK